MRQINPHHLSSEGFHEAEMFSEALAEVVSYLTGRGLAAESPDHVVVLERLLGLGAHEHRTRITVSDAARHLYVSRRTLGRICRRAGIPPPSSILMFGRILRTLWLMRARGLRANQASREVGWPDPFSFSNAMHRLAESRPGMAPERGLLPVAEAWLVREMREGRAELRTPRPPLCPSCGRDVIPTSQSKA